MKCVYISEEIHSQLKVYAATHKTSLKKLVENKVGNLLSQKATSAKPQFIKIKKEDIEGGIEVDKEKALLATKSLFKSRGNLNAEDYI